MKTISVLICCVGAFTVLTIAQFPEQISVAPKAQSQTVEAKAQLTKSITSTASITERVAAATKKVMGHPLRARGDSALEEQDAQQIIKIYNDAEQAALAVENDPDALLKRRQIKMAWAAEMDQFVAGHPGSPFNADIYLQLGRAAHGRAAYGKAMAYYAKAWDATKDNADLPSPQMAREASGALAPLLAATGRTVDLKALEGELVARNKPISGGLWWWAKEIEHFADLYPEDSYKCGLWCLDSLARSMSPGAGTRDIVETKSSTNGFTVAELLQIGGRLGFSVTCIGLTNYASLPVPAVVHLNSAHFVFAVAKEGSFLRIKDPLTGIVQLLSPEELADEGSGVAIIDQRQVGAVGTWVISGQEASKYRGRCHAPLPWDFNDPGPCPECDTCPCPKCVPGQGGGSGGSGGGSGGGGPGSGGFGRSTQSGGGGTAGNNGMPQPPPIGVQQTVGGGRSQGVSGCGSCGMINLRVVEPYLNPWLEDVPLEYEPGYGPKVQMRIMQNWRRYGNNPAYTDHGEDFQGASIGLNASCSWLSWLEYLDDGTTAFVMLPSGSWDTFTFSGGASMSSVTYRQNLQLEKLTSGGSVTGFILHYDSGRTIRYDRHYDQSALDTYSTYFMTKEYDAVGNYTSFAYDSNNLLTTVTSADSKTFTFAYDGTYTTLITNVVASYGPTVGIVHGETDMGDGTYDPDVTAITRLVDPVGIVSRIGYGQSTYPNKIITPYGETDFECGFTGVNFGAFDRGVRITYPNGAAELYLLRNQQYIDDFPSFDSSVIPSSTPIGTLDTATRSERNSYHWSIRQWSGMAMPGPTTGTDYGWANYKLGRIRHWLANTDPTYTHFDTLSWEQEPSPDGGTTEGQITWYDYPGKVMGHPEEIGTQVLPGVIARVMPDGTTWYDYITRNTIGYPTQEIEKWDFNGSTHYRTNSWSYSTDGIDLVEHRFGPSGGDRRITGFGYDITHPHLPTSITNSIGEVITKTYDTSHRLVTMSLPSGLVSSNTFGTDGFVSKIVDYHASTIVRTNSYTWLNGLLYTHTDARSLTTTWTWDNLRRPVQVSYPDTTTEKFAYTNGSGTMTLDLTFYQNRLGAGFTNTVEYNCFREPLRRYDALGRVTAFGYCDCGALSYITNAYGVSNEVTSFTYDFQDHLLSTYFPDGSWKTNSYDIIGRISTVTDPLGTVTHHYDNLGRPILSENAFGLLRGFGYDNEDRITIATNQNGTVVTSTYDDIGRISTRTYPDTGVEAFGYTANTAGATSYTNQVSKVTQWIYDEGGRKRSEVIVGLSTNSYTYAPANDLLTLVDGKSQTTTWDYDLYGHTKSKTYASGGIAVTNGYDAIGRLTAHWTSGKGKAAYRYDAVNNLTNVDYPSSADFNYEYDALNRVTKESVTNSFTSVYSYYPGGALQSEDGPFASDTISYFTNSAGLRSGISIQQPTGAFTNGFTYDSARRLSSVVSTSGTYGYSYLPANNGITTSTRLLGKLTLPSTSYITNFFDANGRETETTLKTSGNVELNDHAYVYNVANQRIRQTYTDNSYVTYTYDDAGELRTAYTTNSLGNELAGERYLFGYDAAWNLTKRTNNASVSTYTFNGLNEDTSTYSTYDGNGNPTAGGSVVLEYDDDNRLTAYQVTGISRVEFKYDARGRMRKRVELTWSGSNWTTSSETWYLYDGMLVVQERSSANTPQTTYTRGYDLSGAFSSAGGIGGLLGRSIGYNAGTGGWSTHQYYHADGNGNITYLESSTQTIAASYRYDPFGRSLGSSGSYATANVYRFSSKEFNSTSGFYIYGFRFYDPQRQRWINRDPIEEFGGVNLFGFDYNDPIDRTDSLGLTVYSCTVPTSIFPTLGLGTHNYLWDDRPTTPNNNRECGQESCSGSNSSGTSSKNTGPIDGNSSGVTPGTECIAVPGSAGKEDAIMADCVAHANGAWVPGVNDCHTKVDDCLGRQGLPSPDNPRFRPKPPSPGRPPVFRNGPPTSLVR